MGLKAAVIGCGRMGAQKSERLRGVVPGGWLPISHAESILNARGVELLACVDSDSERLAAVKNDYNIPNVYTDYENLFLRTRCDLVTIATRTPLKKKIIDNAIKTGIKAIYVEKPITNNLKDCEDILNNAKDHNCIISYGVNRRFHEVYREVKQKFIVEKKYGELTDITIEFGKAPLLWTHPHSFDLLRFFGGDVLTVRAGFEPNSFVETSDNIVDSDPVLINADIDFVNGAKGHITTTDGSCVRLSFKDANVIIHGDGAFYQISKKTTKDSPYFLDQQFVHPQPKKSATVTAVEELASFLKGELSEQCFSEKISKEDIYIGLNMALACAWSFKVGERCVSLSEVPIEFTVTGKVGDLYA